MTTPNSNVPQPINVPAEKTGDTVQSFIDNDDVKQMDVSQQADGTFTVTPKK